LAILFGLLIAGTVAIVVGALVVAWSGIYNVAASRGHMPFFEWFLEFGMRHSVARNAANIEAPNLDKPDLVRLGAGHFYRGCAFCHGAPGVPVNPVAEQMLPVPPDLAVSMRPWKDRELFWIVKHGFKYTGMPGWVASEREDEIWAVAAFLKRMPELDVEAYRDLVFGAVRQARPETDGLATASADAGVLLACGRCHGTKGQLPISDLVPVLHGQPADFLIASLKAYAEGTRRSGVMQVLISDLTEEDMQSYAAYYAGLVPPARPAQVGDAALIENGRTLAMGGMPAAGVPPCITCHGNPAANYPRLAGQPAAYISGQLRLWKMGHGSSSALGAIMAPIARQLTDGQIDAVAAYYAALPPEPREAPEPEASPSVE
jgi:cytochrome c553